MKNQITDQALHNKLAAQVQSLLREKELWLATAESCTGGLLGSMVTDHPGASEVFLGGVISYANEIKANLLGVERDILLTRGAVSQETALAMASGVRRLFASETHPSEQIISVSITGIAGPGGGSDEKPVGLVWIGIESCWEVEGLKCVHHTDRLENKQRFAVTALELLLAHLERNA